MKYMYTSPKIIYDNDESSLLRSQLFEMASGELNAFPAYPIDGIDNR